MPSFPYRKSSLPSAADVHSSIPADGHAAGNETANGRRRVIAQDGRLFDFPSSLAFYCSSPESTA
ncbi:MAG TPA: hypothetical protein VHC69_01805 [Polyangiaceae bacterium]|nr:hypothetical protein [Polyangiaceae bacterium]